MISGAHIVERVQNFSSVLGKSDHLECVSTQKMHVSRVCAPWDRSTIRRNPLAGGCSDSAETEDNTTLASTV